MAVPVQRVVVVAGGADPGALRIQISNTGVGAPGYNQAWFGPERGSA